VDGHEQVGSRVVGQHRPSLKRNENVVLSRHRDAQAVCLQTFCEASRNIEDEIFLEQAAHTAGPVVVPAVAGIEDNRSEAIRRRGGDVDRTASTSTAAEHRCR
jgi:hypothetical protein